MSKTCDISLAAQLANCRDNTDTLLEKICMEELSTPQIMVQLGAILTSLTCAAAFAANQCRAHRTRSTD